MFDWSHLVARLVIEAHGAIVPLQGDIPADPMSVAAGGAVSGNGAAVAGSVDVNIITSNVHATLGNDARVNQGAAPGPDQGVTVSATNATSIVGAAGSLAGSLSSTGIGAAVEVDPPHQGNDRRDRHAVHHRCRGQHPRHRDLQRARVVRGGRGRPRQLGRRRGRRKRAGHQPDHRRAHRAGSDVAADGSIGIGASDTQDITTISGNAAGGGNVGVAGSFDVVVLNSNTQAYIAGGAGTKVAAGGNLTVAAVGNADVDMIAGGLAAGGTAGVGASSTTLVHTDVVQAYIGPNAEIATGGAIGLSVLALSTENVSSFAVAGGAAGAARVWRARRR